MKIRRINIANFSFIVLLALTLAALAGCSPSTPAASQSGPTYPLAINLLDTTGQFTLDSQGRLTSTVQLSSTNGNLGLFIYSGTKVLDKSNQPLQSIKAIVDSQPPLMPENTDMVGAVYDLGPAGAQFNPAPQVTIAYNPKELKAGANENDLYVSSYQDGSWTTIQFKRIDTVKHTITTSVDHSTKIAVLLPLQETTASAPIVTTTAPANPNAVKVVVAGYMNHGPLQSTIQSIKDVLAKYGDKVSVTWVDLGTTAGAAYFKANGLSAHMNIIINGKYQYQVNGKTVTFQWFEGQGWTKADLDAVLSTLVKP
jgi:hypothetical protein